MNRRKIFRKYLNVALIIDVLAIIGIFVGGILNSTSIIFGCIIEVLLTLTAGIII